MKQLSGSRVGEGSGPAIARQGGRALRAGCVDVPEVSASSRGHSSVPVRVRERVEAEVGEAGQLAGRSLVDPLDVLEAERVVASGPQVPSVRLPVGQVLNETGDEMSVTGSLFAKERWLTQFR